MTSTQFFVPTFPPIAVKLLVERDEKVRIGIMWRVLPYHQRDWQRWGASTQRGTLL